jgi:hypothetical protein
MSHDAVSPLRRRMIEDITIRQFSEKTRGDYIRQVPEFTPFLGRSPDCLGAATIAASMIWL